MDQIKLEDLCDFAAAVARSANFRKLSDDSTYILSRVQNTLLLLKSTLELKLRTDWQSQNRIQNPNPTLPPHPSQLSSFHLLRILKPQPRRQKPAHHALVDNVNQPRPPCKQGSHE